MNDLGGGRAKIVANGREERDERDRPTGSETLPSNKGERLFPVMRVKISRGNLAGRADDIDSKK